MKKTYFVVGELIIRKTFNITVHANDANEAEGRATQCALNNNMFVNWDHNNPEITVTNIDIEEVLDENSKEKNNA